MSIGFNKEVELLTQAAAWRVASLLLERPQPGWRELIEKLSAELADQELSTAAEISDETEGVYHSLFGPGGKVSPREVSYCGFEDPGRLMSEIVAFYGGFSFRPRREEPIDHISVESGFVGYLFLKEAYAWREGNQEAAKIAERARERFINEHVSRCAEGMQSQLGDGPAHVTKALSWIIRVAKNAHNDVFAARDDHGL